MKSQNLTKGHECICRSPMIPYVLWLFIINWGLVLFLSISPPVLAQNGYPQPSDLFVNDYAELLAPEDEAEIRALFSDLKRDSGIEAVVVTIGSIHDYDTPDETIESFATHLFNTWGIGGRERNDGVLILVARQDRKVRIEVGSGYGDSQNANMQQVIDEHILPYFRQEDYPQGIRQGARAVAGVLTGSPLPESGPVLLTILGYPITWQGIVRQFSAYGCLFSLIGASLLFIIYLVRRSKSWGTGAVSNSYDSTYNYSDAGSSYTSSSDFGGGDSSGGGASGDW